MIKTKHASIIEKEIKEKKIELRNLNIELVKAKKRLHLKCNACKQKSKVGEIVAVERYFAYDAGYCIGTDYQAGDLEFICPKCDIQNRLIPQGEMERLRSSFKELIDEYKGDEPKRKFVNWDYDEYKKSKKK